MGAEVIAAIIGFCGVGFAAVLSAFGYLLKARVELKRSARLALYYLMEIRYSVNTALIDPDRLYKRYMEDVCLALEVRGIPVKDPGITPIIEAAIYAYISNIVGSIRTEIDERLLDGCENALKQLASERPVLAYQLKGKERIHKIATHTMQYTDDLESDILPGHSSGVTKEFLLSFSGSQKAEVRNEIADMLDGDILLLARSCGVLEYIKCRRALKKSSRLHDDFDIPGVDEFVNTMIESLKLFVKAQAQAQSGK